MVEIRYGEHYELASLAGKNIAEVREQYKQEFGIPDRAQAKLNGQEIGKKHELKQELKDDDEGEKPPSISDAAGHLPTLAERFHYADTLVGDERDSPKETAHDIHDDEDSKD